MNDLFISRKQVKTDRLYIDIALRVAEESYSNKLKVGSIMVKHGQIVIGYNGTPSGWSNVCEVDNITVPELSHAESNMVGKVMRSPINSTGATVYVTHAPCLDCSKILFQAGVKRVVFNSYYKTTKGIDFLKKAGTIVHHFPTMTEDKFISE